MKNRQNIFTKDFQLVKRLSITLLIMTLTRIIFWISNYSAFTNISLFDFLAGIWMDCITIGIYFIPFYILSLLPLPFYFTKWYQLILKILFHITNSVIIILNLVDLEYFKYTGKRSTADLFSMVTEDNDMNQLAGAFLKDFWWIFLIGILLIFLSNWLYNKTIPKTPANKFHFLFESINLIVLTFSLFIIGRGGFTLRPADMLTAAQLTSPQKVALVANTPLSIIKTIGKDPLVEKFYFEKNSEDLFNPIHKGKKEYKIKNNPNIVVIILESFGNEWLGAKTGLPFTPFFDSILNESLYFENAFANGKKSIEAVPTIFAGIPSLSDNPYVSSIYGTNTIKGLPQLLEGLGYSSAFYHGATNGSMKFDVFTAQIGFKRYFGRTEFNNEDQCDDTWGALDEYFLPWSAASITKELQEPFLAGLFTLSSHHPYYVPEEYQEVLPKGKYPIAQSIAYADMSLRLFFEAAKMQPWYENTIFVFTADHTPAGQSIRYQRRLGMYEIPIAIFDPKKEIKPKIAPEIFNQMDIMPTLLDIIGYSNDYYCFGTSYFRKEQPFSINYIANSYMYYEGDYVINFLDDEPIELFNYKLDTLGYYDSLHYLPNIKNQLDNRLKKFIQRYNHDLIYNKMIIKE